MSLTPKKLVADLCKQFGDEAALLLGGENRVLEVCPTGMPVLDRWVLGVGGVPFGRIMEIYGDESSGKTTIADRILAGVQRMGGIAALIETEQSYDPAWAKVHGVNVDDLVLMQPSYLDGEGGMLAHIEKIIIEAKDKPVGIVLDSVAATPTKREHDEGIEGGAAIGEAARAWSQGLRTLAKPLAQSKAFLVLINQTRTKIGVMYGDPTTTPGGSAIKFYSSIRLQVFRGKNTPEGDGRFMSVTSKKNKVAPPFRKASLKMDYATGFNDEWSVLDHAKEMKLIDARARSYEAAMGALGWGAVGAPGSGKGEST